MTDKQLEINQIISEFNNKLDRTSGENREQMKTQLQADFDLVISFLINKDIIYKKLIKLLFLYWLFKKMSYNIYS